MPRSSSPPRQRPLHPSIAQCPLLDAWPHVPATGGRANPPRSYSTPPPPAADQGPSFHPGYLTEERLAKAQKLKLAITAGIGSDHVDLNAANRHKITVAEVTGSNVVSVAEHVVMTILLLVRNFVPAHEQIQAGGWDVAAAAKDEFDLEGKVVGTVAVGRIGERVLRRLKPFDCKELLYFDYQPLKPEVEKEIGCRRVDTLEEMLGQCDVVTINCPLHEKTRGLFDKEMIAKMKKGMFLSVLTECIYLRLVRTSAAHVCRYVELRHLPRVHHPLSARQERQAWHPPPFYRSYATVSPTILLRLH
jgi:hypothetical protein